MDAGWEQALRLKMEQRSLNFCALERRRPQAGDMLEDAEELGRKKAARDPMSHRIIEKRRRDRMNNCLADLSRLIPAVYLKKGRGRIEKTEIIEMAIKHLRHLQAHSCKDPSK
ncbi:transcription factor cwo-like isoform X4 [Dermacentor silvarum]|uniref:transcription factor cwo-like isoform X4 n=1 Tax=Dermacentor silvarum TaxID=543639 RepID=UPI001898A97A|nr:transcription factor cwo-like isoform X4 [Dermacentor silvarum]